MIWNSKAPWVFDRLTLIALWDWHEWLQTLKIIRQVWKICAVGWRYSAREQDVNPAHRQYKSRHLQIPDDDIYIHNPVGFFQYFYIQIHLIHQKVLPTYFYMKMRKQKPNEHTTKKQNTLIFCFIVSESISIPIIKCIWFKTIFPSSQFLSILLVRESFLKCWFTGFSWNSDSKITKRYFYTWAIFLNITCTEKNKMQVIFWIQVIPESWYQLP